MTSKQKLSQIKSFAKDKIKELIEVLPAELYHLFDWSAVTLHMQGYSYGNEGLNLISVFFAKDAKFDEEELEYQLEQISRSNHIGLYATVDKEMWQVYFFNKALNNHIKTFHLMMYDDDKEIQTIVRGIQLSPSQKLTDHLHAIRAIRSISEDVYVRLVNHLYDEKGEFLYDSISVDGILQKVTDNGIILQSANFAEYDQVIKYFEDWHIDKIEHWQRKYEDIPLGLL